MPTYDKAVGNSGTMRMVDNGSTVVLQVRVGFSSTFWGSVGYSWSGAGGSGSGSFGYPGGSVWQTVRTLTVSSSGNVSWTVNNTGTSEFGGPHTQTQYINRGAPPPAPDPVGFSSITHTSVRTTFSGNGDGGAPIIRWEIAFGTNSSGPGASGNTVFTSSGTKDFDDLTPGDEHYAWARGVNAEGNGAWSSVRSFKTLAGCRVRSGGSWKYAIPYVRSGGVWKPAVPYVRSGGSWKIGTN